MCIIIKINTEKITNWMDIVNCHEEYCIDSVLHRLREMDDGTQKEVIDILTGQKECTIEECNIEEKISTLITGKKSEWNEYIQRYNDYLIVQKFLENESYAENIIDNLKKKFKNIESEIFEKIYTELKLRKLDNSKHKIDIGTKNEILESIGEEKKIGIPDKLKEIFNYDQFRDNTGKWNRHRLLTKLGIEVCPYCNRQYITSYEEDGKEKATADLDHYYPRSKYPFLALSLYNFIPSCQICNSRFKGDKTQETIYPYEESFDDEDIQYKFETSIKGDVRYLIGEDKDFTLSINKGKSEKSNDKLERADNSNKIFKLDKVYQSHKGYVEELFEKAYKYNEIWRSDINGIFKSEDSLFIDKKELFEFAFGKYLIPEEYSKRPLAKLTRDILDELGIEVK